MASAITPEALQALLSGAILFALIDVRERRTGAAGERRRGRAVVDVDEHPRVPVRLRGRRHRRGTRPSRRPGRGAPSSRAVVAAVDVVGDGTGVVGADHGLDVGGVVRHLIATRRCPHSHRSSSPRLAVTTAMPPPWKNAPIRRVRSRIPATCVAPTATPASRGPVPRRPPRRAPPARTTPMPGKV